MKQGRRGASSRPRRGLCALEERRRDPVSGIAISLLTCAKQSAVLLHAGSCVVWHGKQGRGHGKQGREHGKQGRGHGKQWRGSSLIGPCLREDDCSRSRTLSLGRMLAVEAIDAESSSTRSADLPTCTAGSCVAEEHLVSCTTLPPASAPFESICLADASVGMESKTLVWIWLLPPRLPPDRPELSSMFARLISLFPVLTSRERMPRLSMMTSPSSYLSWASLHGARRVRKSPPYAHMHIVNKIDPRMRDTVGRSNCQGNSGGRRPRWPRAHLKDSDM